MVFSAFFGRKRAGPARQHRYRPVLKCLEDRQLLSAGYGQVNLASDVPGLALVTDSNLVNPWGMAYSPTGPFWFSENASGVSDILDGRGEPFSLVVTVPSVAGSRSTPTGTVFNGGTGFVISENGISAPTRFLFASEAGIISGWTTVVDPTQALVAFDNSSSGAVYMGLAIAADPTGHSFLYAADFGRGTVEVFDQDFRPVVRPGSFRDASLPEGFSPFNIENINGLLLVTYAQQHRDQIDAVAGVGNGFIDEFDTNGNFIRRFASRGPLNDPWGLALAPADFGPFGGALIVGNNGDGRINAYDPGTGAFLGQLADDNGHPIAIDYLWALMFGNGHVGGDSDTLFFTAGIDAEAHGLFGAIQAPGHPGGDTAGAGTFDPNAPGEPADYPLPPRNGPAFRPSTADLSIPVADLLALSESSLVLVPTLISQPPMPTDGSSTSAPVVVVASTGSAFMAVPALNTIVPLLAGGDPQLASGAYNDTVGLNTLLDVNSSRAGPQTAGAQGQGIDLKAAAARSLPSADRDAGAWGLLPVAYVENAHSQLSEEQDPQPPAPSGQPGHVLTGVPGVNPVERPHDDTASKEQIVAERHAAWARLIDVFYVLSMPVMWTGWLSYLMWRRESDLANDDRRGLPAGLRPIGEIGQGC